MMKIRRTCPVIWMIQCLRWSESSDSNRRSHESNCFVWFNTRIKVTTSAHFAVIGTSHRMVPRALVSITHFTSRRTRRWLCKRDADNATQCSNENGNAVPRLDIITRVHRHHDQCVSRQLSIIFDLVPAYWKCERWTTQQQAFLTKSLLDSWGSDGGIGHSAFAGSRCLIWNRCFRRVFGLMH